jgi:hypothetical protein
VVVPERDDWRLGSRGIEGAEVGAVDVGDGAEDGVGAREDEEDSAEGTDNALPFGSAAAPRAARANCPAGTCHVALYQKKKPNN